MVYENDVKNKIKEQEENEDAKKDLICDIQFTPKFPITSEERAILIALFNESWKYFVEKVIMKRGVSENVPETKKENV